LNFLYLCLKKKNLLKSQKIYFLNISNSEELKSNQEPEEKQVLDKDGKPTKLAENWRLSYTPDKNI